MIALVPPPLTCAPWCEGQNHHLPMDRACWGPATYIDPLSLSQDPEPERVGVYSYRRDDTAAASVKLHIELEGVDADPCLTAREARALAEALTAAADAIEGDGEAVSLR
jgi:uncharacterized protein DUF6907